MLEISARALNGLEQGRKGVEAAETATVEEEKTAAAGARRFEKWPFLQGQTPSPPWLLLGILGVVVQTKPLSHTPTGQSSPRLSLDQGVILEVCPILRTFFLLFPLGSSPKHPAEEARRLEVDLKISSPATALSFLETPGHPFFAAKLGLHLHVGEMSGAHEMTIKRRAPSSMCRVQGAR